MAIYTKTGDDGTTALYGGRRLSKTDLQVGAYGSVDELTSALGVLMIYIQDKKEREFILIIQEDLHVIMGCLAQAPTNLSNQEKNIKLLERKIDTLTARLPSLTHFILPNGSPSSCHAHMARVICRRTERSVISYFQKNKLMKERETIIIMKYINRLSDLLFTYARTFNIHNEVAPHK
ncbi:MAG: cob(I)yrinic acid a,c-diamide adenosyltransferase [bacterium]